MKQGQVNRNGYMPKPQHLVDRDEEINRRKAGGETFASIARSFDLSPTTVRKICHRKMKFNPDTGRWAYPNRPDETEEAGSAGCAQDAAMLAITSIASEVALGKDKRNAMTEDEVGSFIEGVLVATFYIGKHVGAYQREVDGRTQRPEMSAHC